MLKKLMEMNSFLIYFVFYKSLLKNYANNCLLDKAVFKYFWKMLRSLGNYLLVTVNMRAAHFKLFCSMNIFQHFFQGISRYSLPCILNNSSKRLFPYSIWSMIKAIPTVSLPSMQLGSWTGTEMKFHSFW